MSRYNQNNNKREKNLKHKAQLQEHRNKNKEAQLKIKRVKAKLNLTPQEVSEEKIALIAGQAIMNIKEGKKPITNMFVLMLTSVAAVNQTVEAVEAGPRLVSL